MSNSFVKLLVSQLFANLADIFFRVTIIANIYIISKSVIATSLVPILIGISSFVASLLVPLVTKRLALNRVLSLSQFGKTSIDERLRTRLRVIIWKQWKKKSRRLWGLLKLGVPKWIADKVSGWGDHYQLY
ncbi:transporter major facilitator family protein [Streptococcus pneumoniae]|nr:transporter major facilitator family protein [Streptococcus pneumoniae]